jgi:hypothetical protein
MKKKGELMKKWIIYLIATMIAASSHAGLTDYIDSVGTPSDGGTGPSLWYKTARSPNSGTGGASYILTSGGVMTNLTADFWGNADSAYGLEGAATQGASIPGSTGLFASGTNGTVSFLFKTPASLSGFVSLFNQGQYSDTAPFEVGINVADLRITTTQSGGSKVSKVLGTLSPDTWYYFCMRWDTSLGSDNLTWYYGATGGSLNSGTQTIISAGDNKSVLVGGRNNSSPFLGGFFQNIAVYERTLTEVAVQNQFDKTLSDTAILAAAYTAKIETPTDGGSGPELWFKNADQISGTHLLNSGSAGVTPSTHQAYRLGEMTHTDFFGNADMAVGISGTNNAAAVTGSTDLFMTGSAGTVCTLFKTPASIVNASLFKQGSAFELYLIDSSTDYARLTVDGNNITLPSINADTWYYLSIKWDTTAGADNLTWYMGEAGSTLNSGTATITGTGAGGSIDICGRATYAKFLGAVQQFAVYERELTDQAVQDQFDATLSDTARRAQAYSDAISGPEDGGDGPALWYKTARSPNEGSGGASYTLTSGGQITNLTSDVWGIADSTFGLDESATQGAAVAGSTGLFATGTNGTVCFLFKTGITITNFTSLFNQGAFGAASQLELSIENSQVRLGTQNDDLAEPQQLTHLGISLAPETWYYAGITWDTSVSTNNLTWYHGIAGAHHLKSGTATITSAGANSAIFVGGRGAGSVLDGGFFQHIAVYERTLSDASMQAQFDAISQPLTATGFAYFTDYYGITGQPNSGANEDYDGDGLLNLAEYALDGTPTDDTDTGAPVEISYTRSNTVNFSHVQLTDPDANVTYIVEQREDLLSGDWATAGVSTANTNTTADPDFDELEHQIDSSAIDQLFLRLRITQP